VISFEESLVARPEDAEALRDFFARYGFKTMLRDLGGARPGDGSVRPAAGSLPGGGPLNSPEGAATLAGMPVIKGEYETILLEEQLD
ncbi:hypothetical protein NL317_29560, partial [Klebsiella pneumoniae]|nr:hypothetical protein [Klebsiella pneumoniae]